MNSTKLNQGGLIVTNVMIIGYPPEMAGELKKRIRQVVAGMGKRYEKTSVISGIPGSSCVSMDDLARSEPFLLVRDNDVPKAKLIGKRLQMELRLDVEVGKLEAFYGRDDGPLAEPSYPVKATFIMEKGTVSLRLIHEACGGKAKAEFQDLPCGPDDMKNLVINCLDCSFDQTILTNREMRRELALVAEGRQEEAALGFGLIDKKCIVFRNPT